MVKKETVHEALDLEYGIIPTFLTLFTDPKRVVTNPDKFTRPWKYATYVTSISCLFTWFVIHYFIDVQDEESFWLVPKRMLELAAGYQSFYENTQPLKRLVLGALSLYIAMLIFLFKERNQPPGFLVVCFYVLGHSVFITFIMQALGVLFVRQWNSNVIVIIGIATHISYLTYAIARILGQLKWTTILFKGIGIFVVLFTLYNAASTRLVHHVYYGLLHRGDLLFRIAADKDTGYTEEIISQGDDMTGSPEFIQEVTFDSLKIMAECAHPSKHEVAKITMSCFSNSKLRWSSVIFEKINRYSPDPREFFLRVDTTARTAFAFYRVANDSNATIQLTAVDVVSGKQRYVTSLQPRADDTHLYDVAIDSSAVYLCGSTQYKFDNVDLGMIAKIEKHTGKVISLKQLGSTSFASWTSFRQMKVLSDQVSVLERRNYKWMFLFSKTSWATCRIDKRKL
jgi:hypothetical protein